MWFQPSCRPKYKRVDRAQHSPILDIAMFTLSSLWQDRQQGFSRTLVRTFKLKR